MDSVLLKIALVTAVSGIGGTGLGGVIGASFKKDSQKIVSLLLSFAAGVMLSVVCLDLLQEALNIGLERGRAGIFEVIAAVCFGYVLIYLLNYAIDKHTNKEVPHVNDESHPKTADDLEELIHSDHLNQHKAKKSGLFIAGVVMAFAIALHNLPEGIVIGASYAKDSSDILSGSGFIMALVIGLHNIPEGMAVSVPLIAGGDKKLHAVFITALSGAPTIIGALIGYCVGMVSELMLLLSLSFASGAMLYVVMGELLPEAFLMWKSKMPAMSAVVGMMVGLIIIYI